MIVQVFWNNICAGLPDAVRTFLSILEFEGPLLTTVGAPLWTRAVQLPLDLQLQSVKSHCDGWVSKEARLDTDWQWTNNNWFCLSCFESSCKWFFAKFVKFEMTIHSQSSSFCLVWSRINQHKYNHWTEKQLVAIYGRLTSVLRYSYVTI